MPLFPDRLVPGLLQRLSREDRLLCLREQLVAAAFLPGLTLYAAVTDRARQTGEALGLRVVARITPSAYRMAVRHVLGPLILEEAVHGLARQSPLLSARRRLTLRQSGLALCLASAIAALGLLANWGYVLLLGSVLAGLFFAMTVMIRMVALVPAGRVPARPPTPLRLPSYSVLVPLLRETAVLPELIRALTEINYPALCIKRTKSFEMISCRWRLTGRPGAIIHRDATPSFHEKGHSSLSWPRRYS